MDRQLRRELPRESRLLPSQRHRQSPSRCGRPECATLYERRRIRSRRVAESDDSRELHSFRRPHRDRQHPEALRLQLVRCCGRLGRWLRKAYDCRRGSLHGTHRGTARIHCRGLPRRLARQRREWPHPRDPARHPSWQGPPINEISASVHGHEKVRGHDIGF